MLWASYVSRNWLEYVLEHWRTRTKIPLHRAASRHRDANEYKWLSYCLFYKTCFFFPFRAWQRSQWVRLKRTVKTPGAGRGLPAEAATCLMSMSQDIQRFRYVRTCIHKRFQGHIGKMINVHRGGDRFWSFPLFFFIIVIRFTSYLLVKIINDLRQIAHDFFPNLYFRSW